MRIEDLERELRAERPEIDPEFSRRLDEWSAAGFPRGGPLDPRVERGRRGRLIPSALRRAWERVSSVPPRRILAPVGTAGLVLVVAGASVSQVDFGGDSQLASGPAVEDQSAGDGAGKPGQPSVFEQGAAEPALGGDRDCEHCANVPGAGSAAAGLSKDVPGGVTSASPDRGGGIARGTEERKQDRTARINLGAPAGEVQEVANEVVAVTDRHQGIVLDSQVTTDQSGARASFELEIPVTELDAAIANLSELGDVISRTEASEDITQPFVRAQRRYAATLERIEELRIDLIEADTQEERLVIKSQINSLKARADAYAAQRDEVAREARFATVAVEITSNGPDADDDGWSLGDAVDDAGDVLRTIAGIGLVSLAVLAPLALVGGLAYWISSAARRQARERALDS